MRTPATWTNDSRVTQCFSCRCDFSMFNRKHHCRVCGRIFCNACSSQKIRVPSFIRHFIVSSYDSSMKDAEKRVCTICYATTEIANNNKKIIYILANLPLTLKEFYTCMMVSTSWRGSIKTLLALWNSLQYKLPHSKFTKLEISLLENRFHNLAGHSAWAIQILKALKRIPLSIKNKEERIPCSLLLCKPTCENKLSVYDILEIYTHNHELTHDIDQWCSPAWHQIDLSDTIILMPWWVHIFRKKPHIAIYKFIHSIKLDEEAVFAFFFELKLQSQSTEYQTVLLHILNNCLKEVDKEIRDKWQESEKFLDFLTKVATTSLPARRERFITEYIFNNEQGIKVTCPWDTTIIIHAISNEIKELKSASKPIKITLYTNRGNIDILYKFEDVRKDRMTMNISYWLEKTTKGKISFTRYNVFPITSSSGIIQMLDNVTTLYDIKHKYNTTLQNFILERNSNLSINDLRNRFIKSVAAACVLSYFLGVGDRHLENMLVTDDGKLIHVDFYYLMGDDPKHVSTEMRITPDMLDALGGSGSATFTAFQELCADVYKILREKSSFWYCLLIYIADAVPRIGNFWGDRLRVQQHVLERLCPGELDNEACMQIVEIVKRNSKDTWSNTLSDTAHGLANSLKSYSGIFNLEL